MFSIKNDFFIRNLSFGENQEKTSAENKPKLSTETKILVGAGLTALAAVGIYIATRGKTKEVKEKQIEQLKDMVVSQFKKAGNKFEKGRALTSTGDGYTGTLTHTTKDGKNIALKYENGFLIESRGGKFPKIYEYDDKGNLIKITDGKNTFLSKSINGETTYVRRHGEIDKGQGKGYIAKYGKLKYVIGSDNTITFYNSDSSIPSGSKLKIRKAGDKFISDYMLDLPNGEKILYDCIPDSSSESTVQLKQIMFTNPKNKQSITIYKERDKFTDELTYYIRSKKDKSIERSLYNQHKELQEGPQVDELLPIFKYIKNIHKDIYRTLDDFGGLYNFSKRYC